MPSACCAPSRCSTGTAASLTGSSWGCRCSPGSCCSVTRRCARGVHRTRRRALLRRGTAPARAARADVRPRRARRPGWLRAHAFPPCPHRGIPRRCPARLRTRDRRDHRAPPPRLPHGGARVVSRALPHPRPRRDRRDGVRRPRATPRRPAQRRTGPARRHRRIARAHGPVHRGRARPADDGRPTPRSTRFTPTSPKSPARRSRPVAPGPHRPKCRSR